MKFIKFPIVPVLFGFIIGILTQNFFDLGINSIIIGLLFSTITVVITYFLNIKKKFQSYFFEVSVLFFTVFVGIFATFSHREINSKSHFLNFLSEKNRVQGVVSEKLKATVYYDKFILKASFVNQQNCIGKLILYVPKKVKKRIEVGNIIQLFETPKVLQNSFNPHQ